MIPDIEGWKLGLKAGFFSFRSASVCATIRTSTFIWGSNPWRHVTCPAVISPCPVDHPMAKPILSEDSIHALADAQPDAVFLVDKTGIIRYVNPRCHDSLGFAQSDLIGQTMLELVVQRDRDRTIKEASEVLAGHKRTGFENRYRHQDGSDIHFSWSARWLESHQLRLGTARDVTILRQPACAYLLPPDLLGLLDPYEQEVFLLLLTSATEMQIARRLGVAADDMRRRVASVYRKLGVRGRLGLTSLGMSALQTPLSP
jgi:PAS domain S-box-containing protein